MNKLEITVDEISSREREMNANKGGLDPLYPLVKGGLFLYIKTKSAGKTFYILRKNLMTQLIKIT